MAYEKTIPAGALESGEVSDNYPVIPGVPSQPLINTFFERLPDCIREEDEKMTYPLKRWLTGVVDQAGDVEVLLERMYFDTVDDGGDGEESSDLGNPATADAEWLPWMGQLVGVRFPSYLLTEQRRELLTGNGAKFKPGSNGALTNIASTELVGGKSVRFHPHTASLAAIGEATEWDLLMVTKPTETLTNLMSQIEATFGSRFYWDVDQDSDTEIVVREGFYQNRALRVRALEAGAFVVLSKTFIPIAPSTQHTGMLSAYSDNGDKAAELRIYYYNASNILVGFDTEAITLTEENQDFSITDGSPADAVTARVGLYINSLAKFEQVGLAQAGLRVGTSAEWLPRDADPVGAIIESRQKPAGVVVHHEVSG